MAETIGRVEFLVGLDGSRLPAEARTLGREVGAAGDGAGKDFAKQFDAASGPRISRTADNIAAKLSSQGKLAGGKLADDFAAIAQKRVKEKKFDVANALFDQHGFDDLVLRFGDVDSAVEHLRTTLRSLNEENVFDKKGKWQGVVVNQKEIAALDRTIVQFAENLKGRLVPAMEDTDAAVKKSGFGWQSLSHNTRQWTLIIGAVAAGMQDLAVLGSALGGGLLAGGAALGGLVVGGLGLIPVFKDLNAELRDLPPSMRGVAKEFDGFKTAFSDTGRIISQAAFKELPGTFESLTGSLHALAPGFANLGDTIGRLGRDMARSLKPGTDQLDLLNEFLFDSADIFESLARTAGRLGGALLRAFDRAGPLVEDLLGWVDKLVRRFDDFTKSANFDVWIGNARAVFGDLGGLLDATGRALNNMVNPGSVARTREFLDNLTGFMPNLERLIDVIGRLDVFGLIAEALNVFGRALEPLAEPAGQLADAMHDLASAGIEQVAAVLGVLAAVLTPVARGLADVLGVITAVPGAVGVLTFGLLGLSGAMKLLDSESALKNVNKALGMFSTSATVSAEQAEKLSKKIEGGIGKAAVWGTVVVGIAAGIEALKDWVRAAQGVDDTARNLVASNASLEDSFNQLSGVSSGAMTSITDWSGVLDDLGRVGNPFENFALAFSDTGQQALALAGTLGELDQKLGQLPLEDAAAQFASWAKETGASDQQMLNMLNKLPSFKGELEAAANAAGEGATDQALLERALNGVSVEQRQAADTAALQASALEALTGKAVGATGAIDGVADAISNMGSVVRNQRDAARGYEASIDDLSDSLKENGATLDITTEAGRTNQAALDELAQSTLDLAGQTYEMTGSQEQASAAIDTGRKALIDQLAQFGIVGQEAEDYADSLGLIPGDVTTIIDANTEAGMKMADGFAARLVELGLMKPTPEMLADSTKGDATVADFQASLEATGLMKPTPELLADSTEGDATVSTYQKNVTDLGFLKPTPKLLADSTAGTETLTTFQRNVTATGLMTATPVITVNNKQALDGTAAVQTALANVKSKTVTLTVNVSQSGNPVYRQGDRTLEASGDIIRRRTDVTVGEAGPEAIVPLRRPLSMVAPSVRWLSAIAQNKTAAPMGGGSTNPGKVVTFQPGAIVVQGSFDPRRAAFDVANQVAQTVAG
jgi:hypothetical protein